MNMFPSNIQSEFTVKLDHPIEIDEESWEVALAEIATPSEVLNITGNNNFFLFGFSWSAQFAHEIRCGKHHRDV